MSKLPLNPTLLIHIHLPVHVLCVCVTLGKDMEDELVHNDTAAVHRGLVDCQVYCGLVGLPLRPNHDSAAASPHPAKDFHRAGAQSGRFGFNNHT